MANTNNIHLKDMNDPLRKEYYEEKFNAIAPKYIAQRNQWIDFQKKILATYVEVHKEIETTIGKKGGYKGKKGAEALQDFKTAKNNELEAKIKVLNDAYSKEQNASLTKIKKLYGEISKGQRDLLDEFREEKNKTQKQQYLNLLGYIQSRSDGANAYVSSNDATTHNDRVWEKAIIGLEAYVEYKLSLLEEKTALLTKKDYDLPLTKLEKIINDIPVFKKVSVIFKLWPLKKALRIKREREINKIFKSINSPLKHDFVVVEQSKRIEEMISDSNALDDTPNSSESEPGYFFNKKISSPKKMKKRNKEFDKVFKKYRPFYKIALNREGQWTKVSRLTFKRSNDSHLFASIHEQDPKGKLTSSSRKHKILKLIGPSNVFKVTDYLLDENGNALSGKSHRSFRGAQLATVENAEKVFKMMLEDKDGSARSAERPILFSAFLTAGRGFERKLLKKHKDNIDAAADQMETKEREKGNTDYKVSYEVSNIGINALANSTLKLFGQSVQLGWHTNIEKYMNPAIENLSVLMDEFCEKQLNKTDPVDEDQLKELIYVGTELKKRWISNDFAYDDGGYQFLAYWQVMHELLGVTVYKDCKSGKDRTGEVEARVTELLGEIDMLRETKAFDPIDGNENTDKIENFKKALGFGPVVETVTAPDGELSEITKIKPFVEPKEVKKHFWSLGMSNITNPEGVIEIEALPEAKAFFPKMAAYFNADDDDSLYDKIAAWRPDQHRAINRHNDAFTSLFVTKTNTAQSGFKYSEKSIGFIYEVTNPTKKSVSGFDRDYLLAYTLQLSSLPRNQEIKNEQKKTENTNKNEKELEEIIIDNLAKDFLRVSMARNLDEATQKKITRKFIKVFKKRILSSEEFTKEDNIKYYKANQKPINELFEFVETETKKTFQPKGEVISK